MTTRAGDAVYFKTLTIHKTHTPGTGEKVLATFRGFDLAECMRQNPRACAMGAWARTMRVGWASALRTLFENLGVGGYTKFEYEGVSVYDD